ncbi:uncharacterized protein LOC142634942 [Castanea sativa]|uniref:uncharacterized protein LOC142634942 n=1 Tax=Castanea sativa TaxID=21020 RepID=UPI003F64A617
MWPSKLKGDPNKRFRDNYCRFHCDHSHDTSECYDLKQQIEALIRQGKLQRFVSKDKADNNPPQEQVGRRDSECTKPPLGGHKDDSFILKMAQVDNPIIGFLEKDARCLPHPHDDALVVNIWVGDFNTHRVLVNNGSSANILYYPAFQQMRIEREQLVSTNAPLVGFGGMKVYPLSAVTLP